jgi:hypothetical protein
MSALRRHEGGLIRTCKSVKSSSKFQAMADGAPEPYPPFRPRPLRQAKTISASRILRMPNPLADDVFSTLELTSKVKKLTLSVKQAESAAQLDWGRH